MLSPDAITLAGRIKLYLTALGLSLRKEKPDLFLQRKYLAIIAEGEKRDHVVAFARTHGRHAVVALVPRLTAILTGGAESLPFSVKDWGDTTLPLPGALANFRLLDIFTGHESSEKVADALNVCPVAIFPGERTG